MSHKTILCIIFVMLFLSACASRDDYEETETKKETVPAAELIKQADNLYEKRDNLDNLRQGVGLLQRARNAEPKNYEANWKLARFNYYLGSHTEDDKESEKAFKQGVSAGQTASSISPEKPDGYFWTGANIGGRARKHPLTDGATSVNEIKEQMNKVIEIQPDYQGASAYDALAQVELSTGIFGGSADKAVEYLEKALALEDNNSNIRVHLAEAYLAKNRKEDAKKQLEYVLAMKPDPAFLPEFQESVAQARKLLETRF